MIIHWVMCNEYVEGRVLLYIIYIQEHLPFPLPVLICLPLPHFIVTTDGYVNRATAPAKQPTVPLYTLAAPLCLARGKHVPSQNALNSAPKCVILPGPIADDEMADMNVMMQPVTKTAVRSPECSQGPAADEKDEYRVIKQNNGIEVYKDHMDQPLIGRG